MRTRRADGRLGGPAALLGITLGLVLGPAPIRAQLEPTVELCHQDGQPAARFDLRPLFGEAFDRLVTNGIKHEVVAQVVLREATGPRRILATSMRIFRLRYYLWEEYFKVEVTDPGSRTIHRVRDLPSLRGLLTTQAPLVLPGEEAARPSGAVFVQLVLDLDPMDKEQLDKLRRRFKDRRGGGTGGSSLFTTMVGLFVDRDKFRSKRRVEQTSTAARLPDLPVCPRPPPADAPP